MSKQIGFDWRRVLGFACAGAVIAVGGAAADARAGGTDGWEGRAVVSWGQHYDAPFGLATTSSVAAGFHHTVALKGDGTVACWEYNDYGQCNVPAGLSSVTAVAAGYYHTIALKVDGTVACWGYNGNGQCNVPAGLGPVTAVAAGFSHTIAVKVDGTVACWGYNGDGQCNVPEGFGPAIAAAGGYFHTVALKSNGTLACWGYNGSGQCNVPAGLGPATAVAAGSFHTVALQADGTVACWGYNYYGQCNVPAGLAPVTAVAAGELHTVALKVDGTVACWGYNGYGQCNVPAGLGPVTAVAAGGYHTVVLTAPASYPVRALMPPGLTSYSVFPSISAALLTPSSWPIEVSQAAYPGFSIDAFGRSLSAPGNFDVTGSVYQNGGTIDAVGRFQVAGSITGNPLVDAGGPITTGGDANGRFHSDATIAIGANAVGTFDAAGNIDIIGYASGSFTSGADIAVGSYANSATLHAQGRITIPASASSANITSGGDISIGTSAVGSTMHAGGQITIPGDATSAHLTAGGNISIQGDSSNSNLASGAAIVIGSAASGSTMSAVGSITIPGAASSSHLTAGGNILIGTGGGLAGIDSYNTTMNSGGRISIPGTTTNSDLTSVGDLSIGIDSNSTRMNSGGRITIPGAATNSDLTSVGDIAIGTDSTNTTMHAGGRISIPGSAIDSNLTSSSDIAIGIDSTNSTMHAGGRITIPGTASYSNLNTTYSSAAIPGITIGSIHTLGTRTSAASATQLHDPIDLAVGATDPTPDLSCAHRLILDGGVYSSNPLGATDFARFDTCTDPAYSAVTPCLEFGPNSVIDLPPGNKIISHGPTTTLVGGLATLRNGSSIETDADLAIGGSMRIPVGTAISLSVDRTHTADPALSIRDGGELVVEFGSSVQVAAPAKTAIAGALTVDQSALFSLLGGADTLRVDPHGDARCFGGTIRADQMILAGAPVGSPSSVPGGRLVGVNALVDVGTVRAQGGSVNLATSTLVGDLVTEAQAGGSATVSTVAASGQIFGNVDNGKGKLISIGNLVVVGDVTNGVGSQVLAQVGIIYITGSLHNNGSIYGNVITAPGYNGNGTGGTQVGDGIRVAGAVDVGPSGELRFVEDLWKFSVCGDVSLACTSDNVRFNGAKLSLDGCNGTVQTVEATSRDLGCVASAFSGAETQVSLIGELEVASGATVQLVDNFNNAPGKTAEVVYARGLTVQPGATLITNGIKVITRNALIQGTVDNMANICVVVDAPDPDVNGDGHVNAIDLAFILTYWGTSAPIADLDRNGVVGASDMAIVLNGWTWNN